MVEGSFVATSLHAERPTHHLAFARRNTQACGRQLLVYAHAAHEVSIPGPGRLPDCSRGWPAIQFGASGDPQEIFGGGRSISLGRCALDRWGAFQNDGQPARFGRPRHSQQPDLAALHRHDPFRCGEGGGKKFIFVRLSDFAFSKALYSEGNFSLLYQGCCQELAKVRNSARCSVDRL